MNPGARHLVRTEIDSMPLDFSALLYQLLN
jgi:hypothetical protein